jgi:hypothetical protein
LDQSKHLIALFFLPFAKVDSPGWVYIGAKIKADPAGMIIIAWELACN